MNPFTGLSIIIPTVDETRGIAETLEILGGTATRTEVVSVRRGEAGCPGELRGAVDTGEANKPFCLCSGVSSSLIKKESLTVNRQRALFFNFAALQYKEKASISTAKTFMSAQSFQPSLSAL